MIRTIFCTTLLSLLYTQHLAAAVPQQQKNEIEQAIAKNDWDTAEEIAEDLTDQFPRDSEAYYLLALAIRNKMENVSSMRALMNTGDYNDALDKAISLDPSNVKALNEQIGYLIFAPGVAGGDREEAAEKIKHLQRVSPIDAARMSLSLASAEENTDKQIQALDSLIQLEPDNKQHPITKAIIFINQKKYPEADTLLEQVEQGAEERHALAALYQRARWRIIAKQEFNLSEQWLRDYIKRFPALDNQNGIPDLSAAYWRLGLALELSNDKPAAVEALKTSVELNPEFKEAKKDLKRLR